MWFSLRRAARGKEYFTAKIIFYFEVSHLKKSSKGFSSVSHVSHLLNKQSLIYSATMHKTCQLP